MKFTPINIEEYIQHWHAERHIAEAFSSKIPDMEYVKFKKCFMNDLHDHTVFKAFTRAGTTDISLHQYLSITKEMIPYLTKYSVSPKLMNDFPEYFI